MYNLHVFVFLEGKAEAVIKGRAKEMRRGTAFKTTYIRIRGATGSEDRGMNYTRAKQSRNFREFSSLGSKTYLV